MTAPRLPKATAMAHQLIRERLTLGDWAIDATVGNGHDTQFLANCVGEAGVVIGFDIQTAAISNASERLADCPQVSLHQADHSQLANYVQFPVSAIMFNLGYLPSGNKTIITQSQSTIPALESCIPLLKPNGIITIAIYTGHEGGIAESHAVEKWAVSLPQSRFTVAKYQFLNQVNTPPYLIAIERKP